MHVQGPEFDAQPKGKKKHNFLIKYFLRAFVKLLWHVSLSATNVTLAQVLMITLQRLLRESGH
jgi:hypothetical protein